VKDRIEVRITSVLLCAVVLARTQISAGAQTFRGAISGAVTDNDGAAAPDPVTNFSSGSFGLLANTRNVGSAPGVGPGEPRNVQLALKVLFLNKSQQKTEREIV
jgi:hypothetical protein